MIWRKQPQPTAQQQQQCYDDEGMDDWLLQRWEDWFHNVTSVALLWVATHNNNNNNNNNNNKVLGTRPQEWLAWPSSLQSLSLPPGPQQQQSLLAPFIPVLVLLAVSFVLLLWRWRWRGAHSQQQQARRRGSSGLNVLVDHPPPPPRLRSDSGTSLLFPGFPPHLPQRGRRDRSSSSLDLFVQQLQQSQQQQQQSTFHTKNRLNTWSSTGRLQLQLQQQRRRRAATRRGVLPTSKDIFRDADLLEEDLEWITSDLLEQMIDYEERTARWAALSSSTSMASPSTLRHRVRTSSSTDASLLPTSSSSSRHHQQQQQQQSAATLFRLWGPGIHTITYQTVTPPPTWTEASRRLLITDVAWELAREVSLHLTTTTPTTTTNTTAGSTNQSLPQHPVGTAVLVIQLPPPAVSSTTNLSNNDTASTSASAVEATPDWAAHRKKQQQQKLKELERHAFRRPVTDCSLHVHRPAAGGVLEIYETTTTARGDNNSNNPWMEHLFPTAAEAAQFQLDFMALQVLGPTLHNMYQALALLHQGSPTFVGVEPVLHDDLMGAATGSGMPHSSSGPSTDEASTVMMLEASSLSDPQPQQPQLGKKRRDDSRPVLDQDSGVAWDDVMRCLGSSFPSLRLRLEAIWWLHVHGVTVSAALRTPRKKDAPSISPIASSTMGGSTAYLTPDYYDDSSRSHRRLLLGPVDFFRLFVPLLPETAVPAEESHRARMEQWIRWRKRAGRASVLVQAYTRARTVVNLGWNVAGTTSTTNLNNDYWNRRWAYDDEIDNRHRDAYAKNEYYEGTVSRDVMALVRGAAATTLETESKVLPSNDSRWWWSRHNQDGNDVASSGALSLYQGFSLVGMHAFQWPKCAPDDECRPSKDPVQCIPSLCQLIGAHPKLDFFVHAYFLGAQQAVIIKCFVRSLPKGIDPRFDTVVHRYFEGDAVLRDRKLEVILQLSMDKKAITLWGRFLLWWLSLMLTLSRRHNMRPTGSTSNTTTMPALRLAECGKTHHFGGSIQTDTSLPTNYVASTIHIESQQNMSFTTRLLLSYLESGGLARNVSDFTYVIAGEAPDELPERALGMTRVVHSTLHTLPMSCVSLDSLDFTGGTTMNAIKVTEPPKVADQGPTRLYLKIFVMDPLVVAIKSMIRSVEGLRSVRGAVNPATPITALLRRSPRNREGSVVASIIATATDPLDRATNELIKILEGVKVPARRCPDFDSPGEHHSPSEDSVVSGISALAMQCGDFIEQSILNTVSRETIKRYFIASDCSLRTASVRLIESATWRAVTFPIDIRTCRIELQTGQFFQQGKDLDGNPVFYFRNTCLGPWRKDEDAVIAAVLHRLETSLEILAAKDPLVQCTLIVIMGRPYRRKKKATKQLKKDPEVSSVDPRSSSGLNVSTASSVDGWEEVSDDEDQEGGPLALEQTNNPRVFRDEVWNPHTSRPLIERLIEILLAHYPERLSKALVVLGHKNKRYVRSIVGGVLALASVIPSSKTRDKVRFLAHYSELQTFVDQSELVSLVGGNQSEDMKHYEWR